MTLTTTELPEAPEASQPSLDEFHLVRVEPEKLEGSWPTIRMAIEGALPVRVREAESTFTAILALMQARGIIPWILRTDKEIYAILTTTVRVDEIVNQSSLTIYTVYVVKTFGLDVWVDSFRKLSRYAQKLGCENIILETRSEEVAHLAKRLSPEADIETRLVTMPLLLED